MMLLALSVVALAYVFLVSFGALSDLSTFRIPNWISYGLVLLFFLQSIYLPVPGNSMTLEVIEASPLTLNLGVGLFVLIVALIFWARGYIGGGDAKFLVATSLWMGPVGGVYFMILVSGLSVLMALMLKASADFGFLIHAGKVPTFVKQLYAKFEDKKLPFGFPIGIAALIMMPQIFST